MRVGRRQRYALKCVSYDKRKDMQSVRKAVKQTGTTSKNAFDEM